VEVSAARGIPAGTAATWTATLHAPDTCTATEVRALGATLEHDIAPQGAREDGFELDVGAWTLDGAGASTYWRRGSVTPHDARWVGASAPRTADVRLRSPELQASYGSALRLRFRHRHRFESDTTAHWDGGVLEVQVDGGPWEALPADVDPTTGRIEWDATLNAVRTTATNPLAGRRAWVGTSAGWPNLEEVSLDFGTRWAGRAVRFRWRLGSDQSVAREGWELDDVAVEGVSGTPFPARVADATACNDRPPVADAGPDLDARSGDTVLLDGTATADPDGDPLAFTWSQVDGPVVTLDATGATATFVAPSVLAPTVLRLALRASDGELDSHDTVDVTVRPINRAPVADAGPDVTVTEGDVATLDGSASDDPDGDAILFAWTLPADAPVVLDDPASPATSFVAPQVERDTELQVDLSVSDGFLQATDSVVVRILPRNQPPWADAGIDRTVRSGDPVALDASASNDPDGDALSLLWVLEGVEGLAPEIPSAAQTSFRAPIVAVPTDLRVTLTVSDGALTATDTALVHVLPPNLPPVARAGGDRSVPSGGTVVLDASACEDPDGDTLNVGWSIAGDPARIEDAAAAVTLLHAPTVTEDTVYVVTLDVSDGLATATDTFRLTVTAPPPSDTGTDPTPGDTGPLRDTGTDPTPGDTGPLPDTATDDTATDDTATDDTATDDTATDDTAGKPAAEVPGYHADDRVTDVGCRTCGTTRGAVSVTPPGAGDAESGDSDTDRQADGDDAPTASTGESMSPADPEGACGCLYPPSDARPAATVMLGLATFVRRRRRA
jgi:hypothetical protein